MFVGVAVVFRGVERDFGSRRILSQTFFAAPLPVTPAITIQPVAVVVNEGLAATLSVVARGSAALSYQWQKNGVNISGGTLASYAIKAAAPADAGLYSVKVSNAFGVVQSNEVQVSVPDRPRITQQPTGLTVAVAEQVTFSVAAVGSGTLAYQWRKAGTAIPGAVSTTYVIASAALADAGSYSVVVSNSVASVTSSSAALVVNVPPSVVTQPASRVLNPGAVLSLSVTAGGSAPFTYQWSRDGQEIAGATSATYRVAAVQQSHAGVYTVVVSNAVGKVTSQTATVGVNNPVTITAQPVNTSVNLGAMATFSVSASGSGPLTYQWRRAGVAIPGATSSTYSIANVGAADLAGYDVAVRNPVGTVLSAVARLSLMVNSVTSAVANLTVVGPPVITANPVALQLTAGVGGSLTARVRSTLQCSYQWKKNGVALANGTLYSGAAGTVAASATESTLTLGLFNASDLTPGTYTLTVTNAQGSVTSTGASVTVLFSKPKFLEAALVKAGTIVNLRSFADQTGPTLTEVVPSNDTLRVTVMASGTVTYEWRYATLNASTTPSVVLTGQTGASLDFSSSAVNKGPGYYLCRAASGTQATELRFLINSFAPPIAGGQTSVVGASLQIVSKPVSVSAGLGGVVLLDVSVTAGKRVYAWFKEGADGQSVLVSVGETGFLRLDPLTQAHAGAYFVVITDAEGNSLRSRTASVKVLSASD